MLALAWSVYFGFGLVSASLPALITPIRHGLDLTYSQVGVILGAWQVFYIVVGYPAGLFVDRVGVRRALLAGALLVAASAIARAFATDFVSLLAAVALFGCGGPIISIGLPKVVASWFLGRPRAIAAGIYTTGSATGNTLSLAVTNSLVLPALGSWQSTTFSYGLAVVAIGLTWWLLARETPRAPVVPEEQDRSAAVWGTVLRTRAVWLVVIVGFTGFMASHGLRQWLPQILESRGLSPADAGYLAALPGLSGIVGSLAITRLATRVGRKRVITGLLAIITCTLLLVAQVNGPALVPVLIVQGFCAGAIMPLMLSLLMDLREVGAAAMGAAAGLYFAVGEIGGFAGPALMGVLKDLSESFAPGLGLLAAITALMVFPTFLLKDPRR